ncbi:MAG: hypothetical protein A2X23_12530 [Chloroflexi bacterium GWC2_73_18]|nr:MAG: hypothetical protein A2X23_12530 [Chloroflexi bacterium GWC2_73_18]
MKRIALVGGAGLMGRATARDLVGSGFAVTIADIDLDGARQMAATLGPDAAAVRADASDVASLLTAFQGADAVVNVSQYYFNLPVMEACLEARLSYCDLGGLYHTTLKQLAMGERFADRGLLAILGIGSAVGLTNVMGAYIADRLATIDHLRCYDAYAPAEEGLSWAYSLETIFDEIMSRPMVWRDGRMLELDPLSEPERFFFDHGIGDRLVHHTLHSEVATLPFSWPEKRVGEVYFKIASFGYTPEALERLKVFADVGLADREGIEVRSTSGQVVAVRPRELLARVLARWREARPPAEAPPDDVEEVVTVGTGRDAAGRPLTYRVGTAAWHHARWGLDAGTILTGVPPSIAGQWLAEGRLERRGAVGPELALPAEAFLLELAKRGTRTTVQVTENLAG